MNKNRLQSLHEFFDLNNIKVCLSTHWKSKKSAFPGRLVICDTIHSVFVIKSSQRVLKNTSLLRPVWHKYVVCIDKIYILRDQWIHISYVCTGATWTELQFKNLVTLLRRNHKELGLGVSVFSKSDSSGRDAFDTRLGPLLLTGSVRKKNEIFFGQNFHLNMVSVGLI